MGKKKKYNDVLEYINSEHGNGCTLLTSEEEFREMIKHCQPTRAKLSIKCKCGNVFIKDYHTFLKQNRCPECGKWINIKSRSVKYDEIIVLAKLMGLDVVTTNDEFWKEKVKKNLSPFTVRFVVKDKDGYYAMATHGRLRTKRKPNRFFPTNPYTIQNIKHWCKLNNTEFELVSDDYMGVNCNLLWRCFKCNNMFNATWNIVRNGYSCKVCRCLATNNPEVANEWHPTKNRELTPYDVTYGSKKQIWWLCPECGCEWVSSVNNRNKNNKTNSGCPVCSESKGEARVRKALLDKNIPLIGQYYFDDLIGIRGGVLLYDFAIFKNEDREKISDPSYENPIPIMLIEYDGLQHSKWVKSFQSEFEYKLMKKHDKMKNEYCEKNGLRLLRINHKQFDQIEDIISSTIKQLKGEM